MNSVEPIVSPASASRGIPVLSRNRGWPRDFRLSTLLFLMTIALLAPLLAFGAYTLDQREQVERAAERERLRSIALDLADAVDRELSGQIAVAKMLTGSRSLQIGDYLEFWQHAEDAASQADGHFILIDSDYQQLVNTRLEVGAPLPKTNNPEGVDAVLQSGAPVVGNLGLGAVAQSTLYSVRVPVFVEGVARYALSYVPRQKIMEDVLRQSYRPDEWRAAIIDGNGLIMARSRLHDEYYGKPVTPQVWEQVVGTDGIIESVDLEGNPSLTAYHAVDVGDWTVFVWAPEAVLQAPAQERRRQVLIWAALAVAASLLAGWVGGRIIRAPTDRLVAAASNLADGRTVAFQDSLMREANVVGAAISDASRTITERETSLRNSREQMRAVMRELSHRSLNLLTIVQIIAKQSGRLARDHTQFIKDFNERILGLARSQDLLLKTDWQPVPLEDLVVSQLAAFTASADKCLNVDGPILLLRPQAVQYFGMALHELATNALKYGALSVPEGRISVSWSVKKNPDGADRLRFRWEERDGPAAKATERSGFGSVVINSLVPSGLDGEARLQLRKEGLLWELDVPLKGLLED